MFTRSTPEPVAFAVESGDWEYAYRSWFNGKLRIVYPVLVCKIAHSIIFAELFVPIHGVLTCLASYRPSKPVLRAVFHLHFCKGQDIAIRLIVSDATKELINSLRLWGNLDVPVYSPSRKIKFLKIIISAHIFIY